MIYLREYTSSQIVGRSRSSQKYSRVKNSEGINRISVSRVGILDIKEGSRDLNLYLHVTSASDPSKQYRVDLRLIDFIPHLREYALKQGIGDDLHRLSSNMRQFFAQELKSADVKVGCSCPDFTYRFKDSARNQKFYFGIDPSDEARSPNPNKINPHYEGSACKHLIRVLMKPSLWCDRVIKALADLLKDRKGTLAKTLDLGNAEQQNPADSRNSTQEQEPEQEEAGTASQV